MYPSVQIDAKKVANIIHRHPWIFSGAIIKKEKAVTHGGLVRVTDPDGKFLGVGTYSDSSSIAVRVLDFTDVMIDHAWFVKRFQEAGERRRLLGYGPETQTTGYRLLFGEADGVPGLIVDRYSDVLVFQIATAGMDAMRALVISAISECFAPLAIIERSDISTRKEENLEDVIAIHVGKDPGLVEFMEQECTFSADPLNGQKTGFFLDQKETRAAIRSLAKGRDVLNLFSYTGAAGVSAMMGGGKSVHHVDASQAALDGCAVNAKLNNMGQKSVTTERADIFQWFNEHKDGQYEMVIMDPPALIKSNKDVEEGKKAYHFMNRAAMRLVKDGGIFVTSSCSHYFSEEDFAFMLRRASVQANVSLAILHITHQSPDHPVSVYFPEGQYLKTFICQVRV